jgi:hypothetical protein
MSRSQSWSPTLSPTVQVLSKVKTDAESTDMKPNQFLTMLGLCVIAAVPAPAAVRYVDLNSASPTPPYTNWATAATNIQDAVDVAVVGDQILVTNGVYQTGGKAVFGIMTNRVAVDKPVAVQSVNGPEFTMIQGYQVPGTTNGDGAIRCAYLTNGVSLSGFTLTNGATRTAGDLLHERCGGGVSCESTSAVISNCVLSGNSAYSLGGGATFGTCTDCTLNGNVAFRGGGARGCILNNCLLSGNHALFGGGADNGTLINCLVTGNACSLGGFGGGISGAVLTNCTLAGNSADYGGGAYRGTLYECILTSNTATYFGGGDDQGTLYSCTLSNNTATGYNGNDGSGAGASDATLNDCTLVGNSASYQGAGAFNCTLNNCMLTGNFTSGTNTSEYGGGAYGGWLTSCKLTRPSHVLPVFRFFRAQVIL